MYDLDSDEMGEVISDLRETLRDQRRATEKMTQLAGNVIDTWEHDASVASSDGDLADAIRELRDFMRPEGVSDE